MSGLRGSNMASTNMESTPIPQSQYNLHIVQTLSLIVLICLFGRTLMVINLSPQDIDNRRGMLLMNHMSMTMVTLGCLSNRSGGTGSTPEGRCGSGCWMVFPFSELRLGL